jgi:hypothetical protein
MDRMNRLRTEGRYLARLLRRPWLWVLLLVTLAAALGAYQVRRAYAVDVGDPGDGLYLRNFYAPLRDEATGRTYRRSNDYGFVVLPGLGGGAPYTVTLTLNRGSKDVPVTVILNGETFHEGPMGADWQTLTYRVDAAHPHALDSRDLVIELRAPQSGGVMLDSVQVGAPGPGFVTPALAQLAYLLALVALLYLFLARLVYAPDTATPAPDRARIPAVGAALLAAALVGGFAGARLPLTVLMGYLVVAAVAAHLLLAPGRVVARWLAPEAGYLGRLLARPAIWALVGVAVLGGVAAYQVRHSYDIDIGDATDQAYTRNFHERLVDDATGRTYRTLDAYGYIVLTGVGGSAPYSVTLSLNPGDPNVGLTVILNGETFLQQRMAPGWQDYSFTIDAAHPRALAARDLVIELRGRPARTVMVDRVRVGPQQGGFVAPTYSQLGYLGALVLLVYLLLGRAFAPLAGKGVVVSDRDSDGRQAGLQPAPTAQNNRGGLIVRRGAPWPAGPLPWQPALGGAALAALALVGALAAVHLPITEAAGHLVATGAAVYVLLVLAEPLAARLAPGTARGARLAALLFAGAFLVRFGAMALPQTVIIDMPYHLKWMRELLAGNVAALTDPHGGLNEPPREWGLAVFIPKSPLFYFLAAPLALLPGDLETGLDGLVCLLEASTVLFCYGLLARFAPRWGGAQAGLWAGFAYAANPLGFRALSYGILPTILAQWLSLAFLALLLVWVQDRLRAPADGPAVPRRVWTTGAGWGLLLVLLTAALIAFPTIAVFTSLVTGGVALVWLRARYRRVGWAVGALLAAAWLAAIALYYGVYIADLLTQTLPQMLAPRPATAGTPPPSTVHWTGPLDLLGWTLGYLVSPLPLIMGLAGLAVLWRSVWGHGADAGESMLPERLLAPLTVFWTAILPIFVVANYRIDMIGKHLYYTMVPLSLGSGIFLWLLARRGGWPRRAAWALAAVLLLTALLFWADRLVRAST